MTKAQGQRELEMDKKTTTNDLIWIELFFLSKRKINFKHFIVSLADVDANSVDTNSLSSYPEEIYIAQR